MMRTRSAARTLVARVIKHVVDFVRRGNDQTAREPLVQQGWRKKSARCR